MTTLYNSLDDTGKVKVNTIIIDAMANNPEFVKKFSEVARNLNQENRGEGFQAALEKMRDVISNTLSNYPDATKNKVSDEYDFNLQKGLLRNIKDSFAQETSGKENPPSHYQELAQNGLARDKFQGRPYAFPKPSDKINMNVDEIIGKISPSSAKQPDIIGKLLENIEKDPIGQLIDQTTPKPPTPTPTPPTALTSPSQDIPLNPNPIVTSFKESSGGDIDAGLPIIREGVDSNGNKFRSNTANPSGYINYANITCANGRQLHVDLTANELITKFREVAPTTFLGFTLSEGGPSPLAPICDPSNNTGRAK